MGNKLAKWARSYQYYYKHLSIYRRKQVRYKVRKNFMSDDEFISIKTLFNHCKNDDDKQLIIQLIETSKPYKHYRKLVTGDLKSYSKTKSIEDIFVHCKYCEITDDHWQFMIEWLLSHTIHTKKLLEFVHSQENKK